MILKNTIKNLCLFTAACALLLLPGGGGFTSVYAQRKLGVRPTGSGGPLMPEQAAYDVKSYDLDLRVNPDEQSIKGINIFDTPEVFKIYYQSNMIYNQEIFTPLALPFNLRRTLRMPHRLRWGMNQSS